VKDDYLLVTFVAADKRKVGVVYKSAFALLSATAASLAKALRETARGPSAAGPGAGVEESCNGLQGKPPRLKPRTTRGKQHEETSCETTSLPSSREHTMSDIFAMRTDLRAKLAARELLPCGTVAENIAEAAALAEALEFSPVALRNRRVGDSIFNLRVVADAFTKAGTDAERLDAALAMRGAYRLFDAALPDMGHTDAETGWTTSALIKRMWPTEAEWEQRCRAEFGVWPATAAA
jgi:hypothetical protein